VLIGGLYKLDFDLLTDLTPIAELAYEPLLICVKNSLQAPKDTVTDPSGTRREDQISLRHRLN